MADANVLSQSLSSARRAVACVASAVFEGALVIVACRGFNFGVVIEILTSVLKSYSGVPCGGSGGDEEWSFACRRAVMSRVPEP